MGLDRHLYFRSEISDDEPTGKKWIHIQASVKIEQPKEQEVIFNILIFLIMYQ